MAIKIIFRGHALIRMFQRRINPGDVRLVIERGEVIEDYASDLPYPSRLILGWSDRRPIHVVAAYDAAAQTEIVVTVYEPDPAQWDRAFRRRLP